MKFFKRLWRKLFRKKENRPIPTIGHGEGPIVKFAGKKWAGIVGHDQVKRGADNKDWANDTNGKTEYDEYTLNSTVVVHAHGLDFATRNKGGRRGAAKEIDKMNPFGSIEYHNNSYNALADGAEVLCLKGDYLSIEYARKLLKDYCAYFKLKNRGVKIIVKGGRGYYNLKYVKDYGIPVVMLFEQYFLDVESDFRSPSDIGVWFREYFVTN